MYVRRAIGCRGTGRFKHAAATRAFASFAVTLTCATSDISLATAGEVFDAIVARQRILCGVDTALRGFSVANERGEWTGFDVDICHAIAAAVFGDPGKVQFVRTRTTERFDILRSGRVDLLSRNTTWTMRRETDLGLSFAATVFYDGQGFLVSRRYGARSVLELDGATICVQPGTTTEKNLREYFAASGMQYTPVIYETSDEVSATFFSGRCQVLTTDASKLAIFRETFSPKGRADEFVILPEVISKEPLAPVVRKGDQQWRDIVKWTVFALIEAEEQGITRANVEMLSMQTESGYVHGMLGGVGSSVGAGLGLSPDWIRKVIKAVGNYGEIWARHFQPLRVPRGPNRLWREGGLLYSPPFR